MTTEGDREEIENRNIGAMKLVKGQSQEGGSGGLLEYTDPYLQPVKIFDIQTFNAQIMKSTVVPTVVQEGPLSEDKLMPPKTFISSKRHSNTALEDLSETWGISVEQAKLTLDATTQNHSRLALMPLSCRYWMDRMFEPMRL